MDSIRRRTLPGMPFPGSSGIVSEEGCGLSLEVTVCCLDDGIALCRDPSSMHNGPAPYCRQCEKA